MIRSPSARPILPGRRGGGGKGRDDSVVDTVQSSKEIQRKIERKREREREREGGEEEESIIYSCRCYNQKDRTESIPGSLAGGGGGAVRIHYVWQEAIAKLA